MNVVMTTGMQPMVTQSTHSIAIFAFVLMAFVIVVGVVCLLLSTIFPDLKGVAQKAFLYCLLAAVILGGGAGFITWAKGFNSF